ncbi:cytochrome (ubi)quinol oxidase subunit III [Roseateles sp.]|uniref:cytochrome (ubi)quinol oxidase subunit III n=1 Tax=Roseateles sp. TaxID=1971397 RepID=UPI0039E77BBC
MSATLSHPHAAETHAPPHIVTAYGFWVFLISDIVMFAAFFVAYAVLKNNTAGGPGGVQLFEIGNVAVETACLLLSSLTCGLAAIGARHRHSGLFYGGMAATFVLGATFLGLELDEFRGMALQGATPDRSAFLSAFFALVGCHGMHVLLGLVWLLTMVAQVLVKGYRAEVMRRLQCFALFWHALDIVWVALFCLVYLMGVTK